ncbi:CsxC family protein [Anaeromonas frigoriresistens]|uniref:CsxC family protein n=1 Tax=Anaeromonas frigoriresistens TaxID=2683708 RepID=UPI001A9C994F
MYKNKKDVSIVYNNHEQKNNKCGKTKCVEVNGIRSDTLTECDNNPVTVDGITRGVVAKIPVVLAELTLQVNLDSIIDLPEPAIEIKDIKKRVKVTQCLLLQNTNVLFIKGFIRKNIDYSTRDCSNSIGICGDLKHCTVDVPFSCTTSLTFNGTAPAPVINNNRQEFEYFRQEDISGPGFADKDKLLSGDLSEFNQLSQEFFNELPYCELIRSRIVDFNEYLNRRKPYYGEVPFEEKEFMEIEEKTVLELTIKVLQKRQVEIPATVVASELDC